MTWERKKIIVILPGLLFAIPFRMLQVEAPPFTQISLPGTDFQTQIAHNTYSIVLSKEASFPLTIVARGPFGGEVTKTILAPEDLKGFRFREEIIKDKNPNPESLTALPQLCPRLGLQENAPSDKPRYVYGGHLDRLNHIPMFQLLDPDAGKGTQYKAYVEMDGKDVLLLRKVTVRYDYEDNAIIDYEGPHPKTGEPHRVAEGDGGFYANIHYAIVPFDNKIVPLDRQTLLHLAQGKLKEINQENRRPALRTHALIPGPFLSKKNGFYDMCEWGDTAHQAPEQTVEYEEMALWDWNYSVEGAQHILLIVWEGDEEDWLIRKELIHPFYLTDDLIGIFEIRKGPTLKPLTLKNKQGDFEITVQTGNLGFPP